MGASALVTSGAQVPIIRVDGLVKRYRGRVAVRGVDLAVPAGEIYGLIGPDGAGKSSLMKAIAGVLDFDAGEVEVLGIRVDSEAAAERIKARIGFMPQGLGLNLYPDLSVDENIDFFAELRGVPHTQRRQRKHRLLAMTRLEPFRDRPMKHLSGGMKQKLGLVCTLIHEPELVILDEPTTGVDPVSRRDFWAILAQLLAERGITALVSTAYMDEASRFHRVSLLYEGRVLAEGDPDQLVASTSGSVVELRSERQVQALERLRAGYSQVEALGTRIRAFVPDRTAEAAGNEVRAALQGLGVDTLEAAEPELEDVFVALLREARREHAPPNHLGANIPPSDVPQAAKHGTAIEARGLTRDFDRFRAVEAASFSVRQGEIFGLLGANGAGKTTVIKMLTGILKPTEGEGHVAGADMRVAGRAIKRRVGYVSQAFSLYTDLTTVENIELYAGVYGLGAGEARRRAQWIIAMGGLTGLEREQAGALPMGLRQRLALGCALVHRPRVLFLDEPTSGVDPLGRRLFWDVLFTLAREEGVAILITTHYMSEAEHCDRLALMHTGRIIADAPPPQMKREVEAEAGRLLEITARQPLRVLDVLRRGGLGEGTLFGKHIHLLSRQPDGDTERIRALLAAEGIESAGIAQRQLSMEDVFVYRISAMERRARDTEGG